MTTKDAMEFPLIGEVMEGKKSCPFQISTCSTCMYRRSPDDAWKTGDYRDRCLCIKKNEALT